MAEGILGLGNEGVQLAALEIEDLSPLGPVLRDVEDKGVSVLPIFPTGLASYSLPPSWT